MADEKRHHSVIPGNLLSKSTDEAIEEWLGGEKADLVFERMYGGLDILPDEPYMLSRKVGQWYDLLDEGGIMFVEVPANMRYLVTPWSEMISKHQFIEIQTNPSTSAFRLRKLAGAPEKLPLFGPLSVRRISKKA